MQLLCASTLPALAFLTSLATSQAEVPATGISDQVPFIVDPCSDRQRYVCYRTDKPLVIDGVLDEAAWAAVPSTRAFVDIEGSSKASPTWKTTAKMLWDDKYFYVSADLEEPHLWSILTQRDSIIFQDNDFELFIDPDGDTQDYYELEVNALGTEWDLLLERPYRDGGIALHAFDTPGLLTAVHMRGSVNDARDVDRGWTVEIAIPWEALKPLARTHVPPKNEAVWWVNYSRVEWDLDFDAQADKANTYTKRLSPEGKRLPEHNWVWSPQGVIAMHEPESWGLVMFTKTSAQDFKSESPVRFIDPIDLQERALLRGVYGGQKQFRAKYGFYAGKPAQLGVTPEHLGGRQLELYATPSGFEAVLRWQQTSAGTKKPMSLRIDEVGHVW